MTKQTNAFTALLTLTAFLSAGCALHPRQKSLPSEARKKSMMGCVGNFLGQDVSPVDSLHICSLIYSRWEPTTTKEITSDKSIKND